MTETIGPSSFLVRYLLTASVLAGVVVPLTWLAGRLGRLRIPVHRHLLWGCCLVAIVALPLVRMQGWSLGLAILPPETPRPAACHHKEDTRRAYRSARSARCDRPDILRMAGGRSMK